MLWKEFKFSEIIAISDPHAHLATTEALLDTLSKKYPNVAIFVIGDMIDKGRRAKELVELIKNRPNTFALLGNHDHFMIVEDHPSWKRYESLWLYNNGKMTHRSYGGRWKISNRIDNKKKFIEHVNWFKSLPLVANFPNIKINDRELILSHAGIDKSATDMGSLENLKKLLLKESSKTLLNCHIKDSSSTEQRAILDILWNRLDSSIPVPDFGIFNVFGHTNQSDVLIDKHYACIDTTIYKPNKLSAIHLPSMEITSQETLDDTWGEKR
jgi:calcineurin-like phosphoesterase family protein